MVLQAMNYPRKVLYGTHSTVAVYNTYDYVLLAVKLLSESAAR